MRPETLAGAATHTERRPHGAGFVIGDVEATVGFGPTHRGFADLPLNHLGTSPRERRQGDRRCWLALEDSNLGSRIQSPLSYR